jgi:predicted RNA-binding protein with PUA-like domain
MPKPAKAKPKKVQRSFWHDPAQSSDGSSWHFPPRKAGQPRYWLLKQEPTDFSFDDLMKAPGRTTNWNGVRNHVARNFMRDEMAVGDKGFFYHSNAEPSAVVGIVEIVKAAYPDATAFDRKTDYYDPKSTPDAPIWFQVDVRAVSRLPRDVSLAEIKAEPALASMVLLHISRLSVSPVTKSEWDAVLRLAGAKA